MELTGRQLRGVLDGGLYTAGVGDLDPDATYSVVANVLLTDAGPYPALRAAARSGRELGSQVEALARFVDGLDAPIRPTREEALEPASSAPSYVCLVPV